MTLHYRSDIDGLRAMAIVPVVFYHYGVRGFSGGYVGVDVFFVISGFLIASVIHREIETGQFSFVRFYERRIRRIFPALFAVAFATAALGFTELFPRTYTDYAKSLVATGGFLSNFEFWRETGYFDAVVDEKPLLHTWSLAVEEQFYLIFPPLMLLVGRVLNKRYVPVLVGFFVASLAFSIEASARFPTFAFYLLPSRFWELMLGALIAVSSNSSVRSGAAANILAGAGILMITAAVATFTSETPFPGSAALLPCLGTAAVIVAGQTSLSSTGRALGWKPVAFVGQISYSLYLWHWPIYVFAKYRLARDLTAPETTALIALSVVVAALSWRYIEQPFRGARGILTRPALFGVAGASVIAAIGIGAAVYVGHGMPQRFAPEIVELLSVQQSASSCHGRPELTSAGPMCRIGASRAGEEPSFLLWGDSHAGAIMPAVDTAAAGLGQSGLTSSRGACPPLIGVFRVSDATQACRQHNDAVLTYLKSTRIRTVILAARWALSTEGARAEGEQGTSVFVQDAFSRNRSLEENRAVFARAFERTITELRRTGHRVIVIGPIPEIDFSVPKALAQSRLYRRPVPFGPTLAAFEARNSYALKVFSAHANEADYVYPHEVLCKEKTCAISRTGKSLYEDNNHLSRFGAEILSPLFSPVLLSVSALQINYNSANLTSP